MITVGLDFDGLISNLRSYHPGGEQYDAWRDAIGIVPGRPETKPHWRDALVQEALEDAHINTASPLYLRPMPGALEVIDALQKEGLTLVVVTARTEELARLARYWLSVQGLTLPFEATGGKSKNGSKLSALQKWGAIAHVDDTQGRLVELSGQIPHRFLFVHEGYALPIPFGLQVVKSWKNDIGPALVELAQKSRKAY